MQNMKQFFFGVIFFLLPNLFFGQSFEIGAWLGGANSFNDLNTKSSFKTTRPGGGILARYNYDNRLSAELKTSIARTYSSDQDLGFTAFHKARNEASRTTSVDAVLKVDFNFFPINVTGNNLSEVYDFSPYLSAGVGISNLNVGVYDRVAEDYVPASQYLREDKQKLNPIQFTIPIGAGVKYKMSDRWTLSAEFMAHLLFTDYYDNVSTVYNEIGIEHSPGTITEVGFQRGDPSRNDQYNLYGLKLSYLLPSNSCPKFNRKQY